MLRKVWPIAVLLIHLSFVHANAECLQLLPTAADFGNNDSSANRGPMQVGQIQVTCTGEYRLGLDAGQYPARTRRLHDDSGNYLDYYLWQDSGATTQWGSIGTGGLVYAADPLISTGNGSEVTQQVYGSAMTAGASSPGRYTDQVRVLLTYPPYGPTDRLEADLFLSLSLSGTCAVSTNNLYTFGSWPTTANEITAIFLGEVTVECTPGVNYKIGMGAGQNYTNGRRNMRNGSELIPYTMWGDSERAQEWGDRGLAAVEPSYSENLPTPAQDATGTGSAQSFPVWGDAVIRGKKAGTYTDTVTITVVWH